MNVIQINGDGWAISEDVTDSTLHITVYGHDASYAALHNQCRLMIPPAALDALRAMQPRFLPHLRQQRAAIFSERSRKGWQTRRAECKAQQDADIKTMMQHGKGWEK